MFNAIEVARSHRVNIFMQKHCNNENEDIEVAE